MLLNFAIAFVTSVFGFGAASEELESRYEPLNIKMEYLNMEGGGFHGAVEFLRKKAAPHVLDQLYDLLSIRRMKNRVISVDEMTHRDVDLVVIVWLDFEMDEETVMESGSTSYDVMGRPTVGVLKVSGSKLLEIWTTETKNVAEMILIQALLHEMIHILGFSYYRFSSFIDPGTGRKRARKAKQVYYTCRIDPDFPTKIKIEWDVDPQVENSHRFLFPYGIIEAIDARNVKAKDCRCPLDHRKKYTDQDIEHCINYPNHCAVAVVTKNVVEKTRRYFGCDSAKGMELENSFINETPNCKRLWFMESHWKKRLAKNEVMVDSGYMRLNGFVAPFTWALLEDSGWYKVYRSPFVPAIAWGHLKGCAFLQEDCVDSREGSVVDRNSFCLPNDYKQYKCSENALYIESCSKPALDFDQCSVFKDNGVSCLDGVRDGLPGIPGQDSRCFMLEQTPVCLQTKCAPDGSSYRVQPLYEKRTFTCYSRGPILFQFHDRYLKFLCQDPKIICGSLNPFFVHRESTLHVPNGCF